MISFAKVAHGNKTKMVFFWIIFGQKLTRNSKKFCFVSKCNFCHLYHITFVALIQNWKQCQNKPLYPTFCSALIPIVFILTCVTRSGLVNGSSTTSISVSASRFCWRTWRTPRWLGSNLGSVGQHDPAWIVWSFVVTRITRVTRAPSVNRVTRRTSLSLKKWISKLLIRNSLRTRLKRLLVFKAGQDRK